MAGGSLAILWSCRLFLLLLLGWLSSGLLYADEGDSPTLTGKARTQATANNVVAPQNSRTAEAIRLTQQLAETCHATDANLAPVMVAIRPGRFQMGSPNSDRKAIDDERPQHWVTIPHPFAMSRCEVTVGQFKQYIADTGHQTTAETNGKGCYGWNDETKDWEQKKAYNWNNPGFTQTDNHPVVCVSWDDVQRYVDWLSQRTGAAYRLPTEAELEYATRAGTQTARFYPNSQQCDYANGLGLEGKAIAAKGWKFPNCSDAYIYMSPVASFIQNPFDLFDTLGNVWEWTQDCWHESYQDAPQDGSAWLEANGGDCRLRVVRGGSWGSNPQDLRSAIRLRLRTDEASVNLGFRIARDL